VIEPLESIDWYRFLERPQLPQAPPETLAALTYKPILITGAGGSIGSALTRRLIGAGCAVLLLEASESNLYELDKELRGASGGQAARMYLGDAGDSTLLADIFAVYRPQVVFHAAAFKHMPLLEQQPLAAIANNVSVTKAVADKALEHGARVVLLSTDKVVTPTSVMGASKRVAEQIVLAYGGNVVRLANVLGSRGSVSEVFAAQIAAGEALTLTDATAERYFLTVEEAVELLVAAGVDENGGGILVPDLKKAHTIKDLARFMVKTLAAGKEVRIDITGLRAGEKLTELLWAEDEDRVEDRARGIVRIEPQAWKRDGIEERLRLLTSSVERRDVAGAIVALRKLVSEYKPSATVLAMGKSSAGMHE
jgi:FlaA1/EpsC-like NDP-sugar epimerase